MLSAPQDIKALKEKAREEARRVRADLYKKTTPEMLERVAHHLMTVMDSRDDIQTIAGYWPVGSEMDCRIAMTELARRGKSLCLPCTTENQPLQFRMWEQGDALVEGMGRTFEPSTDAPFVRPDMVLVPLLAFDVDGFRLGQGGGYYDRTLTNLRETGPLLAVGIAYSKQLVRNVPRESHDAPLDLVVSEMGLHIPGAVKG